MNECEASISVLTSLCVNERKAFEVRLDKPLKTKWAFIRHITGHPIELIAIHSIMGGLTEQTRPFSCTIKGDIPTVQYHQWADLFQLQ